MFNNHSKNRRIASGGNSAIRRLLQKSRLSELKNRQIIVQIIVQKSPTLTATNGRLDQMKGKKPMAQMAGETGDEKL